MCVGTKPFLPGGITMSSKKLIVSAGIAVVGLVVAVASLAIAATDAQTQPEMNLPPGWTAEDMQLCMAAATPGKEHAQLAKDVGEWHAKTTMWMAPGTDPVESEGSMTITPILDGRFIKMEMVGE